LVGASTDAVAEADAVCTIAFGSITFSAAQRATFPGDATSLQWCIISKSGIIPS
jgi:hypothetical protein